MGQELSATDIRKEIHQLRDWFRESSAEGQRKWMRMGKLLVKVRDEGYWKGWKGPRNESYSLFDEYVEKEVGISKSKAYALLSVCDNLKLPMSQLEELGKSACYELSRLAREKPKSLIRVLERIEKESEKGPVNLQRVRTMVSIALDGSSSLNGSYTTLDFLLREDQVKVVIRALTVLQAEDPLESPSGPAARGVHLVSLCQEFLTEESHKKTEKQLEKAGAFKPNTNFQLEE
jgi:hypothetical protein